MSAYRSSRRASAYQTVAAHTGVAVSDPHGLIALLLDGAIERIASARGLMTHRMYAEKSRLIGKVLAIVEELRLGLDLARGGELAANLNDLYDYIARQLTRANAENRTEILDEVTNLLQEIRLAWVAIPANVRASQATAR